MLSFFFSIAAFGQEICDNGIDDDADGLIDLNDDDCDCGGFGNTSELESLIPNSSFEDRSCCPSSYSQLNCADTWIQASNPTSDYWNTCGQGGSSFDGLATLPIPDGTGFVGFIHMSGWQEYVGACLNQPMLAGQEYDLSFFMGYTNNSPPLDLTFYGTPNCGDLPFSGNDCPAGQAGWVQLGQINVGGAPGWEPITVTFTPTININALVMGGSCGSGGARTYYYMDDMSLISTELFEVLHLSRSGKWCDNDILLTASKDTVIGTYQWYRDGVALVGETDEELDVSGNGYGEGDYTIALLINDQCESLTTTVIAPDFPVADATITNECLLTDIAFTDQSALASGNITNWDWDFGDSNSSILEDPTHLYASDGTFNVTLTVTTDSNCVDVWQGIATVYPNPEADFNSVAGCLGAQSNFTDQSLVNAPGNINQWAWDFGDANTSTTQNPSNLYASINTYNVELTVTTSDGCSDAIISTIDVYPSPELAVSAPSECVLDVVQFVNNSSISAGTIDSYDWDFGDAATSALAAPTHVYTVANTYTIELIATSDEGCTSDTTFQLASNPNPVADFTVTEACLGETVALVNNSSVVAPGVIDLIEFDLGDLSAIQNTVPATYQYANSGNYNLELIVTTADGCDDTLILATNVFDLPTADFSFTNICEDDSVQFNDLSSIPSGAITDWEWDFGNGNTSTVETPNYQSYAADNTYPVSLIVSSGFGCSDTLEDVIEIYPVPIAEFTFDSVCFPLEVQFTDLSEANGAYPITSWLWTFSDAQTSGTASPSIDFGMPGTFSAELLISNGPGCKSTFSAGDAVVHPLPTAEFPTDLAACLEETIDFEDQSSIIPITDDAITTWSWDFDDTGSSAIPSPSHLYTSANIYNVQLTVETNHGCLDDVVHAVEIYPLPNVDFTTTPAEGCAPLGVQFLDQSSISAPYSIGTWDWYLGSDSLLASAQNPFLTYNPEIDPLSIATFDIGLTVTSLNGCISEIFRPNFVTVYPKPDALFSVDDDVKDVLKPLFLFTDHSSENVTAWDWNFGDGMYSTEQHPEHTYPDVGSYPIILTVETQYGCLDTIDYRVKVEPIFTFYVPNSFTPDENGINDEFFGIGEGYTSYSMWIFDRWGEKIFESHDDQFHWDGTYQGKQVQQGTYMYRFYLLDWQGHDHKFKGHVTLHR